MNYVKQENLIDVLKVEDRINVIGCGAMGSWLTFFLIKMGFKNVHVYDFDEIEEHNIPNQLFMESQIGKMKVDAIKEICDSFAVDAKDRLTVHPFKVETPQAMQLEGIVLNCVDTMQARKKIYTWGFHKNQKVKLFIEDRMALYGGYIYTLHQRTENEHNCYKDTLYEDTETEESICGVSQTAIPSAINIASMIMMQMIKWLNGDEVESCIMYQIPDLLKISSTY